VLQGLTLLVNVGALAISLCLGLYLVTRSPRSRPAWLAALTLWSLVMLFFNNALSINLPRSTLLPWLRRITLFGVPFWAHAAVTLRSGAKSIGSRSWLDRVNQVAVPLAYLGAVGMVAAELFSPGRSFIFTTQTLILSDWTAGYLSPVAAAFLLLLGLLAMVNLTHGRQATISPQIKGQFTILLVASVLTALGALYIVIGVWLKLPAPAVPGDLLIGISVTLLGYAVARYNALLECRVIKRDLLYVVVAIGSLTLLVVTIAELLHRLNHQFSPLTLMLIVMVAISTLMLYDGIRSTVDRLFFRRQYRQLRANLRLLARDAGSGLSLDEQLEAVLNTLCRELGIRSGLIVVCQEAHYLVRASRRSVAPGTELSSDRLAGIDTAELDPTVSPLAAPALLVPFGDGREQFGALVLVGARAVDRWMRGSWPWPKRWRTRWPCWCWRPSSRKRTPLKSTRWWSSSASGSALCSSSWRLCWQRDHGRPLPPWRGWTKSSSPLWWRRHSAASTIILSWVTTYWPDCRW
jgi:hypothetical protein